MKTLDLYKKLFTTSESFNDMFFAKHAKMFRELYPDCPQPKSAGRIKIVVPDELIEDWIDEDGYEMDQLSTILSGKLVDKIIDKDVLEYIDKCVKNEELRENITSCVSPIRPVQQLMMENEEGTWYCRVRVDNVATSLEQSIDLDDWEEEEDPEDIRVYFSWTKVLDCSYRVCNEKKEDPNIVIMKWNPATSKVKKEEFMEWVKRFRNGEEVKLSWPVYDFDKVKSGDKVYVLCVGEAPTGIVATGTIKGKPYVATDKSEKTGKDYYVDFTIDMMYNPDGYILNLNVLQIMFPDIEWNRGHSGIVIENNETKDRLNKAHNEFYHEMYLHRPEKFRDRP